MSIISRIKPRLWMLRSLIQTIYFNFHYLPFEQAIHLPIVLYKPKLKAMKGKVIFEGKPKMGQVQLGRHIVSLYTNTGFIYENHGGTIIFRGECVMGGGSAVSVGEYGTLDIGNRFVVTAFMRLVAYNSIKIGEKCRFAWETIVMDTDLHKLKKVKGGYSRGVGKIVLGDGCWVATRCMLQKGTVLPNHTTVQAYSVVNRDFSDIPECSIIGTSSEIKVKTTGLYRDIDDDVIDFSSIK